MIGRRLYVDGADVIEIGLGVEDRDAGCSPDR